MVSGSSHGGGSAGGPGRRGEVRGPEHISEQERAAISSLLQECGLSGVLVGLLNTAEEWDLRPLILNKGQVKLLRIVPPNIEPQRLSEFLHLMDKVALGGFCCQGQFDFGRAATGVWVLRPFYSSVLHQASASVLVEHLSELVKLLLAMEKAHIVHGHLNFSNLGISDGKLALFDFGFDSLNRVNQPREDVHALGRLLSSLNQPFSDAQRECIKRMVAGDPQYWPSVAEIEVIFRDLKSDQSPSGSYHQPASVSGVGKGKLVSGKAVMAQPPKSFKGGRVETQPSGRSRVKVPERMDVMETQVVHNFTPPPKPPGQKKKAQASAKPQRAKVDEPVKPPSMAAVAGILSILVIGIIVLMFRAGLFDGDGGLGPSGVPVASYWSSDKPALMREVAGIALEYPDSKAAMTIITDAIKDVEHPGVNSGIMKAGFKKEWLRQLKPADKKLLFSFGLSELVSIDQKNLPSLLEVHPAVIYAIVATIPVRSQFPDLDKISIKALYDLPEPYGAAFAKLGTKNAKTMADPQPRALAHILENNIDLASVRDYIGPAEADLASILNNLETLLNVAKEEKQFTAIVAVLTSEYPQFATLLQWFDRDDSAGWKQIAYSAKLPLLLGKVPGKGLSFEQYVDLINFPLKQVSERAIRRLLVGLVPEKAEPTLRYLASGRSGFSREQIIFLVSALRLQGEKMHAIVASWLELKPAPEAVLGLLIARAQEPSNDLLNLEAARYLGRTEWEASSEQLMMLVKHKETLARALAYSKMDPSIPEQRSILETMSSAELSEKLRRLILEKLNRS